MFFRLHRFQRALAALVMISAFMPLPTAVAQWTQWGGPNRDFTVKSAKLADKWPDDGPKKIWERPLGEAYSTVIVDDGVLYTMAHADDKERIVALSAKDGKTIWEHAYETKPFDMWDPRFGPGARATPLIHGDKIFSVGVGAMLHALDKKTGKVIWKQDLKKDFDASPLFWGYSSSPMVYKDSLIVPVGASGGAVMAFELATGKPKWKSGDSTNGYAAPIVINVGGEDQIIAFMGKEVLALNPTNGEVLWRFPHATAYDVNATTPIWLPDKDILFISSDYGAGARGLKITKDGHKTKVEELWHESKMGIHFGSAVRIGDYVYGSIGNSTCTLAAINVDNGEIAWRERSELGKASLLLADDKIIIIDEDGQLALATMSPEGIEIKSKFQLFDARSWTAPTLAGNTLYIRDLKRIIALDLG